MAKPLVGWSKCNMDRALFYTTVAIGAVFRNCNGTFIGGFVKPNVLLSIPDLVKAFGVKEALSWLKDRRRHEVIIEIDYLWVVQATNSIEEDVSLLVL